MKSQFFFVIALVFSALTSAALAARPPRPPFKVIAHTPLIEGSFRDSLCEAILSHLPSVQMLIDQKLDLTDAQVVLRWEKFDRKFDVSGHKYPHFDGTSHRLIRDTLIASRVANREGNYYFDRPFDFPAFLPKERNGRHFGPEDSESLTDHYKELLAAGFGVRVPRGHDSDAEIIVVVKRKEKVAAANGGKLTLGAGTEWNIEVLDPIELPADLLSARTKSKNVIRITNSDWAAVDAEVKNKIEAYNTYKESINQPHSLSQYEAYYMSGNVEFEQTGIIRHRVNAKLTGELLGYLIQTNFKISETRRTQAAYGPSLLGSGKKTETTNVFYLSLFDKNGHRLPLKNPKKE